MRDLMFAIMLAIMRDIIFGTALVNRATASPPAAAPSAAAKI